MPMMPMMPTQMAAPMAAAVPCMSSDVRRVSIQIDNPDSKEVFILVGCLLLENNRGILGFLPELAGRSAM